MKDLYSFARTEEEHAELYASVRAAYVRIFERVGLGELTYATFASGGIFSKYSEEFQTVSEAGEDLIYVDEGSGRALNKEVFTDEVLADLGMKREALVEKKSIEVGNIFTLGTRFSDPLGLKFRDEQGEERPILMGCYGIGPGRVMGTIVETLSDEKGIVWPEAVAPFRVHLLSLGQDETADRIYRELTSSGIETLYDDRTASAGEKFAESDLIGIPYQVIIGKKTFESGEVEIKRRSDGLVEKVALEGLSEYFRKRVVE